MKKIMSKSKYYIGDFWVDMFNGLEPLNFQISSTHRFDPDRYEIVEKKDWRLRKVEGEISTLKGIVKHYSDELKKKEDELEEIKREKKK